MIESESIKNSFRESLNYTIPVYFRLFINIIRLKSCGSKVFFDKNVTIMRYKKNVSIGSNCVLKEGVKICPCNANAKISIGKNTSIGYNTYIFASKNIEIGNDCMIAPFVYIVDSDHSIKKGINMNQQPNLVSPIKIGDDVWIGSHVTVLRGVTIENGAVIGTNSVVNKNVGKDEVFAGIPAKKIYSRLDWIKFYFKASKFL